MDLTDAIRQRKVITFHYDGHPRVVHPAAYGTHITTGKLTLRAYQVGGSSSTRVPPLWDLFTVAKIRSLAATGETFASDPPGYRRGDKHLNVVAEL